MRLQTFANCQSGAVTTTFTVTSLALLFVIAAAADVSRFRAERATMQSMLASSSRPSLESPQIDEHYANNFFKAGLQNTAAANSIEALSCRTRNSTVTCSAGGKIPTMLARSFAGPTIRAMEHAPAQRRAASGQAD